MGAERSGGEGRGEGGVGEGNMTVYSSASQ